MNANRFNRGQSTYRCHVCKRLTRFNGSQAIGSDLCPECWDLGGIENMVSDGNREPHEVAADVLALVTAVKNKGGRTDAWLDLLARTNS